ncbi:MAG: hypothetical protein U1F68_13260 [Gammaproteobacteria bacterium]
MSGLNLNLQMAQEAIGFVQRNLPRGAGNRPDGSPDAAACVTFLRSTMLSTDNFIPHLARRALQNGCGNCGEQAAVAYMFLLQRGCQPLDYMNLYNPGGQAVHSFVVVDFAASGEGQSSTWGKDAVVCDPWDDAQAYPAWQIGQKMSLYAPGSTVRSLFRAG